MSNIVILDGNCYLHAGEASWSKNFHNFGFPTSGIYHLMQKVCSLYQQGIPFVVVFDSPSFRKNINSNYKKSRKVDYKIIAQSNVLIPALRRCGVSVLQVPEFEGDDLIANVIAANPEEWVSIYTCDYDAAMHVSKRVSVYGSSKGFPYINNSLYQDVVSAVSKMEVRYNMIAFNKICFGCSSDEIASVGDEAERLWKVVNVICDKLFFSKGIGAQCDKEMCKKIMEMALAAGKFDSNVASAVRENIELVYPRMLTQEEIDKYGINLHDFSQNININDLIQVCVSFGLKKSYKLITRDYDLEGFIITDNQKEFLLRKAREYKMRADAVAADIDINKQAKFDFEPEDDQETSIDYNTVMNGGNIGGF